jgi:hypothetical protein
MGSRRQPLRDKQWEMIGLRLFTENDMQKHTDCCPVDSSTGVDRRTVLKTALNVAAVGLAGSMGSVESAYAAALSKSERDKLTPDQKRVLTCDLEIAGTDRLRGRDQRAGYRDASKTLVSASGG